MTENEAKFILSGYRPNGADADDPHFRDALDLTRENPSFDGWFQKDQELTVALTEKFKEIDVPEDLRAHRSPKQRVGCSPHCTANSSH